MKSLVSISLTFVLTLAFLAAPTTFALACGGHGSCCKAETKHEKQGCCEKGTDASGPCKEKKGCGGDCGNKGCHCSVTSAHAPALLSEPSRLALLVFDISQKVAWYYLNPIPNPVYLAIWLPPKISC